MMSLNPTSADGFMNLPVYCEWVFEDERRAVALSKCDANGKLLCFCTDARGLQCTQPLGQIKNSRLMIYDENKEHFDPQEPKVESWMAPPSAKAKENEQRPDKWTNAKVQDAILCISFI